MLNGERIFFVNMNFHLYLYSFEFNGFWQAVSAKSVADLDKAVCHAEAIHAGIKNDCMSNAFEKLAYVRRDLDNVKYAVKDLHVNDELPE